MALFQRMMGAERSLVTVGRSLTVAKGLVPLEWERKQAAVRKSANAMQGSL